MPSPVQHVFVLMLENRSFDHLLGFSGLSGTDAATGAATRIEGLTGDEVNTFDGTPYRATPDADFVMPFDPAHEFPNVLDQLCGPGVRYVPPYPPINNSGFVDSYSHSSGSAKVAEIMKCFDTPRQLPVLHALAREFAVCDHWFSAMPGPTWPNRMFVHGASSGGLDHSPSTAEIIEWETIDGFAFPSGSIFAALKGHGKRYRLYSGDEFPMVAALKGLTLPDVHRITALKQDLELDPFPYDYVFIEPSYDVFHDYRAGSSQHPLGDVRAGEALIKEVYEALRASPAWSSSLLVVVWDEHGGFFDHVAPPPAVAPGDTPPRSKYNQSGFTFTQYGVRVPALAISPLIPRNTIDHRVYDHSSIPATLEAAFGLAPLTARDASARNLLSLASLSSARTDTPLILPQASAPVASVAAFTAGVAPGLATVSRPDDSVNGGVVPTIIHSALRQELLLEPENKSQILARVASLQSRADAMNYLRDVQSKLRARGQAVDP